MDYTIKESMNRTLLFSLRLMIAAFAILMVSQQVYAIEITSDKEIAMLYKQREYRKVLEQLEVRTSSQLPGKALNVEESQRYIDLLSIAHIYAWRLNNQDAAIAALTKAKEYRLTIAKLREVPPIDQLFLAELYEHNGNKEKAESIYLEFLAQTESFLKSQHSSDSYVIYGELLSLVRYQIDGIRNSMGKKLDPLLPKLPAAGRETAIAGMYLAMLASPMARYEFSNADSRLPDPVSMISTSQKDIGSMILNYSLVLNAPAGSADSVQEKAARAYLAKYEDGYFAMLLRSLLIKNYTENGETEKAAAMTKELKEIANKRGLKVLQDGDPAFATPETTWETFKKALRDGNGALLISCYTPQGRKNSGFWSELDKKAVKKILDSLGGLSRVSGNGQESVYEVNNTNPTDKNMFQLKFVKIDGEWKIDDF
jgi:hypothetical protein